MFIRITIIVSLLGIFGCASAASTNSCSNVDTFSSYDQSGLRETDFGVNAVGTFRIEGEADENKQPMFNLTKVDCEKQIDDAGKVSGFECKLTQALVWSNEGRPDTDKPNCSLDVDTSSFSMKELQKGTLVGIDDSTSCLARTLPSIEMLSVSMSRSHARNTQTNMIRSSREPAAKFLAQKC